MTTQAQNVAIESSQINSAGVLQVPGGGTGLSGVGASGLGLMSDGTNIVWSSGFSGTSGYSGFSGSGISGYSGFSGSGISGYSGATGPTVYPGAGMAVSTGSAWDTSKATPTGAVVGTTDTQTLTNKRVTPRIGTVTSAATITPTADTADQYNVTALATTAAFAIPSGTPTDGQKLSIRIYAGTTQTISWTTTAGGYRIIGTTLPVSVPAGKTIYVGCVYNLADSFWDVVAVATQA